MNAEEKVKLLTLAYNELYSAADRFFDKDPTVEFWADAIIAKTTLQEKIATMDLIDTVCDIHSVIERVLDILTEQKDDQDDDCDDETDVGEKYKVKDDFIEHIKKNHKSFYDDWLIVKLSDKLDSTEVQEAS